MKDIFANLYNKVTKFFHQAEESTDTSAKDVACNRLKLVLMQDRTNLSPAIMDRMKHELIDLLSKYVELDKELLDLSFEQEDNQMALMLSIPVIRAKEESEIEELLKIEDEEINSDEEIDEEKDTEENDSEEDASEDSEVVEETTTESEDITEDDNKSTEEDETPSKDETEEKTEPEKNAEEEKKPEPSKKKSSKGAQV